MKKIILSIVLLMGVANFSGVEASNINVSINIGTQPAWGPVGYDYAPFYYMPDINVYYNVDRQIFYYSNNGRWISARYLPSRYRHYDLYGLYKIVLNDPRPWLYNQHHIVNYRQYRGRKNQVVIRNSRDNRYRNSRKNDVRWYNDSRGNNQGRSTSGRDSGYNNKRSTNGRQDNRQTTRSSSSRNDNRKPEKQRSTNVSSRSSNSQRQSSDRNSSRSSSSRSDNGRSSSSSSSSGRR